MTRRPTVRPDRARRWRDAVLGIGTAAVVAAAAGPLAPPARAASSPADGVREAHVANPYVGARGYVDPQWRALAESEPGGSRVSRVPTGIWIDRVSAIEGRPGEPGLRAHLDTALAQGANLVQVVLDDLPGRNCTREVPGWEFQWGEVARYRHEFVDPLVAVESDPRYGSIRIVNVVERNALAELVVGLNSPACSRVAGGDYVQGVQYALDELHRYSNLYTYLGIGGRTWLGWEDTTLRGVELIRRTVAGTAAGFASVDGFVSNLSDYDALTEPFLDIRQTVGGQPIKMSKWVDWNNYVDELSFVTAFRARLVAAGFDPGTGMLVDTSRNGWGGPARPTRPSTSTTLDTYVDASRVDRRPTYSQWCNQSGAGLGERPRAEPAAGIDAYVWMTPPGYSDGRGLRTPSGQLVGDAACAPEGSPATGANRPTGALPDAPVKGAWFPAAFRQLLANAYPPLP